MEEIKKLKASVTEPVSIDLFFDDKSIDKCFAADFGHAADTTRYIIGGIDEKKRTI